MARLNRRLALRGEILKKCPSSSRWHDDLGDYYLVSIQTNEVINLESSLEELARKEGALNAWEDLEAVA